jgi:putative membrane protein
MFNGFCYSGNWGSLGDFNLWGGLGLILTLIFWVGLIVAIATLVVWAVRRARVPATASSASGPNTAREILQAQYARGEITREQYELKKQDIG